MSFQLQVKSGAQAGKKIALKAGEAVTIGRLRANVVFPDDPAMSGLHFELKADVGALGLTNHSKTNGTRVNGQNCEGKLLEAGDVVQAGATEFVVVPVLQGWTFGHIAPGWEIIPDQGLRLTRGENNVTTVITSQDMLPAGYDLEGYLGIQTKLIGERIRSAKAERFEAVVTEADASAGLFIRTVFPDRRVAIQKQLYAVMGQKVGILTATVMESEPEEIHANVTQILLTASYSPE